MLLLALTALAGAVTPPPPLPGDSAPATITVRDGTFLALGRWQRASDEVFAWTGETWQPRPSLPRPAEDLSVHVLPDGTLFAAGYLADEDRTATWVWPADSDAWQDTGPSPFASEHDNFSIVPLADGSLFLAAIAYTDDDSAVVQTARWRPDTGWSGTTELAGAEYEVTVTQHGVDHALVIADDKAWVVAPDGTASAARVPQGFVSGGWGLPSGFQVLAIAPDGEESTLFTRSNSGAPFEPVSSDAYYVEEVIEWSEDSVAIVGVDPTPDESVDTRLGIAVLASDGSVQHVSQPTDCAEHARVGASLLCMSSDGFALATVDDDGLSWTTHPDSLSTNHLYEADGTQWFHSVYGRGLWYQASGSPVAQWVDVPAEPHSITARPLGGGAAWVTGTANSTAYRWLFADGQLTLLNATDLTTCDSVNVSVSSTATSIVSEAHCDAASDVRRFDRSRRTSHAVDTAGVRLGPFLAVDVQGGLLLVRASVADSGWGPGQSSDTAIIVDTDSGDATRVPTDVPFPSHLIGHSNLDGTASLYGWSDSQNVRWVFDPATRDFDRSSLGGAFPWTRVASVDEAGAMLMYDSSGVVTDLVRVSAEGQLTPLDPRHYVPLLGRTDPSGATRWLSPDNKVSQLTVADPYPGEAVSDARVATVRGDSAFYGTHSGPSAFVLSSPRLNAPHLLPDDTMWVSSKSGDNWWFDGEQLRQVPSIETHGDCSERSDYPVALPAGRVLLVATCVRERTLHLVSLDDMSVGPADFDLPGRTYISAASVASGTLIAAPSRVASLDLADEPVTKLIWFPATGRSREPVVVNTDRPLPPLLDIAPVGDDTLLILGQASTMDPVDAAVFAFNTRRRTVSDATPLPIRWNHYVGAVDGAAIVENMTNMTDVPSLTAIRSDGSYDVIDDAAHMQRLRTALEHSGSQ